VSVQLCVPENGSINFEYKTTMFDNIIAITFDMEKLEWLNYQVVKKSLRIYLADST